MAQALGLVDVTPLGCGFVGMNQKKLTLQQIAEQLATTMAPIAVETNIKSSSPFAPATYQNMLLYKNTERVSKVFICSGGSGSYMDKAIKEDCDLFVIGEISEYHPSLARENGLSLLVCGHWRSETVGILTMQR